MTDQTQDQTAEQQEAQPVILAFQMSLENINGLLTFLANANGAVNLLNMFSGAKENNPIPLWIQIIRSQAAAQIQQLQAEAAEEEKTDSSNTTVQ